MGVTIVEKKVFKKGVHKQTDIYLDYYLPKQARKRIKTPYTLLINNSKTANRQNDITLGNVQALRQAENEKLNKLQSVSLATQKPVKSSVLDFINTIRIELNKPSLYDNLHSNLTGFLKSNKLQDIEFKDIDFDFLKRYTNYMLNDCNLTQNSARAYISRLNASINKARIKGIVQHNTVSGLIRYLNLRNDRKLPDYLTPLELEQFRDFKPKTDLQHSLIQGFLFACYTGLRCGDIAGLQWSEIHEGQLYRRDMKTNKPNYIPLHTKALAIIEGQKKLQGKIKDLKVFPGLRAKSMTSNLKKSLRGLGLTKNVTFHTARRTFARNLLSNGVPLWDVQTLLNHSDIQTTKLYTGIITDSNKDAIKKLSL